jgi:hypothetical protein
MATHKVMVIHVTAGHSGRVSYGMNLITPLKAVSS